MRNKFLIFITDALPTQVVHVHLIMFQLCLIKQLKLYATSLPLVDQRVKNLPAIQETQVPSLGQKDLLEKEMATHPSSHNLEKFMDKGAWWATVHEVPKSLC